MLENIMNKKEVSIINNKYKESHRWTGGWMTSLEAVNWHTSLQSRTCRSLLPSYVGNRGSRIHHCLISVLSTHSYYILLQNKDSGLLHSDISVDAPLFSYSLRVSSRRTNSAIQTDNKRE